MGIDRHEMFFLEFWAFSDSKWKYAIEISVKLIDKAK